MLGRSLPTIIVSCALAMVTLPVQAADLSPEMRGQIEEVVKSYLFKKSEIVRDAVGAQLKYDTVLVLALDENKN